MATLVRKLTGRIGLRWEIQSIFRVFGSRSFLSDGYGQNKNVELLLQAPTSQPELSLQCLHIDQCQEKDLPITSLTLDRLFRSIQASEHVPGMKYYLYKYRHSENGYYLRPWSQFALTQKCIDHDHKTFFEIVQEKAQYGIFPHYTLCNKMLDKYLKEDNLEDACKIVNEIFLLEYLDQKTTQALVVKFIATYWKQNAVEGNLLPDFGDLTIKRNQAASMYIIGIYISNASLRTMGSALLGSIEKEGGSLAVFQDPWGPLEEKNYLDEAVKELENLNEPISQQCVDILLQCIAADEEMAQKVSGSVERLQSEGLIENSELNLQKISDGLMNQLQQFEDADAKAFDNEVSDWLTERKVFHQVEEELIRNKKQKRENFFEATRIENEAHEKAVAKLGYYFFSRDPNQKSKRKRKEIYLQEGYIDGCMTDLELLEGYRKKLNIVKDPIIYLGARPRNTESTESQKLSATG